MFSIIQNYLVCMMDSLCMLKHKQIRGMCSEKHFVVQGFILIQCNNHVQLLAYAILAKSEWINGQMN